ncbi:hypothetical protein CCHR01_01548 [Colletotrichum chrysophilum]|uniref:Uncharacterized protein n=1 Tax=Colletotrichum chrysophilum TaxID=1836956 RepID=A0AAD9AYZ8_9PEZI|nr:hypothetical protein CCHR01_01548 [Colletotrichum chrysophilum]
MGERTGSRVFQWVWSYVVTTQCEVDYIRCDQSGELWDNIILTEHVKRGHSKIHTDICCH